MGIRQVGLALPWLLWGAGLVGIGLAWGSQREASELRLASTIGPIDAGIVGSFEDAYRCSSRTPMNGARGMVRASALVALFVGFLGGVAGAQQPAMEDLRQAPPDRQVKLLGYCRGEYTVEFSDGSSRKFGERDVRFATDSSPLGPLAGRPVLVPTGRVGDRALVIFVGPAEMTTMIRASC
jgi:hypothetical protein